MTTAPQEAGRVSPDAGKHGTTQKHVHHGKTPAAWTGALCALAAFLLGGIAMVLGPNWIMFGIAVVVLVAGLIATIVLQRMGYGAD